MQGVSAQQFISLLTSSFAIVLSVMPAKLSLYREKESDIEFLLIAQNMHETRK
jgi:hypothetical protein